MSKLELHKLEKESERFTIEIKQKETENIKLKEEIDTKGGYFHIVTVFVRRI